MLSGTKAALGHQDWVNYISTFYLMLETKRPITASKRISAVMGC